MVRVVPGIERADVARVASKIVIRVRLIRVRGERTVVSHARRQPRLTSALILTALFATLSGCVTVRSAPARFGGAWPPAVVGSRPSVVLMVTGATMVYGWPRDLGPILPVWGAAYERAYRESALFSDVAIAHGRAELRVDIELRAEQSQNDFLTFLSYLTLLVIPNVETTDIAMVTNVSTVDGQPLGTVQTSGRSRTWYQLLLFPFSSSFEPRSVTPDIVYDLSREAIATLHDRGAF